jgi:hypothetical protein
MYGERTHNFSGNMQSAHGVISLTTIQSQLRRLIKCATIIYLLILIEILIYQHLITITEDRVKYVGEINYQLKFVVQQNLVLQLYHILFYLVYLAMYGERTHNFSGNMHRVHMEL